MVKRPSARGMASIDGHLSNKFSCSTAFFLGSVSVSKIVGSSFGNFLMGYELTRLELGAKRRNKWHNSKRTIVPFAWSDPLDR